MKAYPGNNLTEERKHFNYRLSRARMTIECAFGRLKGRWRCLLKRLDNDITSVSEIVKSCCTLHNICEIHGDLFDEDWLQGVDHDVNNFNQEQNDENINTDGKSIRRAITNWLNEN